ncbi:MAG TPA: Stk1 family PASTA domain-containing Ser/Thr kinase [Actinomycetota bacterium]|nr:Stk1 family PASTA domain-containing Ser/Thr kinase [Actinomycetota bacterium]
MVDRTNGDLSGRTLGGRYRVEGELGRGGMARVYRGIDSVLGRPVAVKVLSAQYAEDATFVARFRREAQAAARLNHPNLVQVYDTGSDDGVHYIVMEYVEAKTLADYLSGGGRIMPERAVELAEAVCDALEVAHAQGVIHRDVKPANIMVTRDGHVKVTDFGIARVTTNETVEQTAAVLGTASYLSPEQAQGGAIDQRSDLYSLGCVLYEMLTGRPPFTADSPVAVASKHVLEQPIPPSRTNRDVSPQLDAVVMRALAKNPDNRYQSAAEMKEDLERARHGMPVMATPLLPDAPQTTQVIHRAEPQPTSVLPPGTATPPARPPRDRTPGWLIALIVFLVLAALGAVLWLFASNLLKSNNQAVQVTVPDVVGKSQADATSALDGVGLTLVVGDSKPSKQPAGTVLTQDPAQGQRVDEGSKVTVVIAKAFKQIAVPSLVGQTVDQATATLQSVGLDIGRVDHQESDQTAGQILSQSPSAGSSVDRGTKVDVVVASPPPTPTAVPIKDYTCQPLKHAQDELTRDGFNVVVSTTPQFNEQCPQSDKVASQDPTSGSFPPGTTVTLVPSTKESPSPSPLGGQ